MKICVIGIGRGRTTVLLEKLKLTYPELKSFSEYYGDNLHRVTGGDKITQLSNELFKNDDFLVKILSIHLVNANEPNSIENIWLDKYDKIYLIERPDFFNQCCSLQVSNDSYTRHQRLNHLMWKSIKKRKFLLKEATLINQIVAADQYIKIKKYLNIKNIPYIIHDYNDFSTVPASIISDPKCPYGEMIINYHMQPIIDNLFRKYFNYESCESDLKSFLTEFSYIKDQF